MELKEKLMSLPTQSGCYIMKDEANNVIYVGKAKNLKRRVNSYFIKTSKNLKTENLVKNIRDFDYIVTNTEYDCLILENNLIKKYKPHYNILLKDDKNFPYIKVDLKQEYPKLEVTRKLKKDGAKYFGPYFAGVSVYQILDIANFAFNLKTCNQKFSLKKPLERACINFDMGLCSGPCINKISKQDYRNNIDNAMKFLDGDTKEVEQILSAKMTQASENLNFELAIKLREQLKALDRLKAKYLTQLTSQESFDVISGYYDGVNACMSVVIIRNGKMLGCENFNLTTVENEPETLSQFIIQYYSFDKLCPKTIVVKENFDGQENIEKWLSDKFEKNIKIVVSSKGNKKKLLDLAQSNAKEYLQKSLSKEVNKQKRTILACERLKMCLGLKSVPYRMECYDISHISGTNKVASMVVFINGEPQKNMYRKFIIRTVEGNNDFASLHETLHRRIKELDGKDISFSQKPNLIVIDGGKGQLSSTVEIVEQSRRQIEIISLAKRIEEVFVPHQSEPVVLKHSDLALQLLQRIRDEAHRFAITFHRSRRSKSMLVSELDNISGLGEKRKKNLLKCFHSVQNIKNASIEEISQKANLPLKVAQNVFEKLNG